MSLNWNATKVKGWDEVDQGKQESLIFATMFVDMGEITEKNHEEFYERYVQFHIATGHGNDVYLTLEDVKGAIGLTTNVFTTTRPAWRKRLITLVENTARDKMWRDKRAAEKLAEEEANNG